MTALPDGWADTTLGELVQPRSERADPQTLGDMPFVGMEHVEPGTGKLLRIRPVSELRSAVALFHEGDILYGRLRPHLNKVHYAEFDGAASAEFIVMPPGDAVYQPYLAKMLQQPDFVRIATQRSTGDRPRVKFESLADIELPLPPLAEQRRIVAKLDSLLARARRARGELARIWVLVNHYRSHVLTAAFSDRLAPDDSSASRGLSEETSRGIGESHAAIPSGWRLERLSDIAVIQSGLALGKRRKSGETLVDVPYVRVANVQRGYLDLEDVRTVQATEKEVARLALRPGDILMNEGGDRDKLGRGWVWQGSIDPCIHQNHVFRVRLADPDYPPRYVSYYANELGRAYFSSAGTQTTNLASISKSRLSALPIPMAPRDRAVRIVQAIEDTFERIRTLERECQRAEKLLENFERTILIRALEGKLIAQEPNDEPATMLLQRLRDARTQAPGAPSRRRSKAHSKSTATKRGRPKMADKTRTDVNEHHLSQLLATLGGSATAHDLWLRSELVIDEFYKLLRDEVIAGRISETDDKTKLDIGHAS